MSVIDISQPTKPVIVWSDTDQAHFWRTTGLSFDPANDYLVASSPYMQTETAPLYPPFPTNTGTISVITLEPAPISVTISPLSEPLLVTSSTVASFQFATNNQLETVECALDGAAVRALQQQHQPAVYWARAGHAHVHRRGHRPGGQHHAASYSWTIQPAGSTSTGTATGTGAGATTTAAPVNTAPPSISGVNAALQTLTASVGTWTGTPTPTFTYQWERCNAEGVNCSAIAGATGRTLALSANDVGLTIEVAVVATSSAGAASASSAHTATVRPGPASAR